MPLAIHGVVAKKDGSVVNVVIGEKADDPVFCISDLLPHLGSQQMTKKATEVIEGEMLDVLVGNRPIVVSADADDDKDLPTPRRARSRPACSASCATPLGIDEEDLLSAELEIVPAGAARDLGLDRSMILGYGQDDRVCAYTSLVAQLQCEAPRAHRGDPARGQGGDRLRGRHRHDEPLLRGRHGRGPRARRRGRRPRAAPLPRALQHALERRPRPPSTPRSRASSSRRTPATWVTASRSTSTPGRAGKGGSNDADAEYVATIRRVMGRGRRGLADRRARQGPTRAAAARSPTSSPSTA